MMQKKAPRKAIARVRAMEKRFDWLQNVRKEAASSLRFRRELRILTRYYTGGQWLHDYSLDEAGLLPHDLKRGVLSEDGVYNFLLDLSGVSSKES